MARAFIGNFKGPKGDKGETGPQGKQGNAGATGQRGSRWTEGTAITGTSTTATVFSGTGIADALVNDMYLNTSTSNVYRCTVGGTASVAKWVFVGCIKGAKGDKGDKGATGATGPKGPQGEKGATGPKGPSGTADTTFTEAATLTKLTSGEPFKAMLGKLAKAVSSVFDKLDKSKVVNNQTTTEAGFALDARQANPNINGSLAKQISDLNGSLYNIKCIQSYIVNVGDVQANSETYNHITFGKSMSSKNYAVITSFVSAPAYWASCSVCAANYTETGFDIIVFNNCSYICKQVYIGWIAIEYKIV